MKKGFGAVRHQAVAVSPGMEEFVVAATLTKLRMSGTRREDMTDPVDFAKQNFGHKLWGKQAEIARAVAEYPRVAVKSCHASGKTFTAADIVLWWITHYEDGIAITSAPTWNQVKNILWLHIHKAIGNSKYPYPEPNQVELRLARDNFAMGFSTDVADRFQGHHGRVLIVFDEASGVRPDLWNAVEGIRSSGDTRFLVIGNPLEPGGPFYDAFYANRARWRTYTISAFDTPNFDGIPLRELIGWREDDPRLDEDPIPYLVSRRWVREKYFEWGPESPMWYARVLGEFPLEDTFSLVSLADLERARLAEPITDIDIPYRAGVDVAGPGESETVCYVRHGDHVIDMAAWSDPDPRAKCVRFLNRYRDFLGRVNVDGIGMGYYFGLHLRDEGFNVELVNVAEESHVYDPGSVVKKFVLLRDEYYWNLRMRFREGRISGLTDELTAAQLSTMKYGQDGKNRIKIESKADAAKRGVRSPDRAEGLMLSYIDPITVGSPTLVTGRNRSFPRPEGAYNARAFPITRR